MYSIVQPILSHRPAKVEREEESTLFAWGHRLQPLVHHLPSPRPHATCWPESSAGLARDSKTRPMHDPVASIPSALTSTSAPISTKRRLHSPRSAAAVVPQGAPPPSSPKERHHCPLTPDQPYAFPVEHLRRCPLTTVRRPLGWSGTTASSMVGAAPENHLFGTPSRRCC
jgi:hypothetical protein